MMKTENIQKQFRSAIGFTSGLLFIAALASVLLSCHSNNVTPDGNSQTPEVEEPLPAVETRNKVAPSQQPVFTNQTRVAGVKTKTSIQFSIITNNLNRPSGLAFLPDGRMVVSERQGTIRIVTSTGAVESVITNIPAVRSQGDGGLLDVKLDPDFVTSRHVYWSYVEPSAGNTGTNCVARGRLSADESSFDDVQVVYRGTSPYSGVNHNGSRMLFDHNGLLYVSFGERFDNAIRVQAQEQNSSLGKIIRIHKDGTPAAGNPFPSSARAEVFSLGHRNPQGLAFHPVTGELWESEHGPQAGDEINIIHSGLNYGWPVIAYGLEYSGAIVGNGTQQSGMEQPVYYWDPAIAPSGMTFYSGTLIPEWKNNLFIAALRGAHIIRLVIEDNKVIGEERLLADQNQRFRHVVQGPDEALYAITDETQGRIYRISN